MSTARPPAVRRRALLVAGTAVWLATVAACSAAPPAAATPHEPAVVGPRASAAPPLAARGHGDPSPVASAPSAMAVADSTAEPSDEPLPLMVAGARACDAQDTERGWCVEGGKAGECLEGWCVPPARCQAYCRAQAPRQTPCFGHPPPECHGNAECEASERRLQAACRQAELAELEVCQRTVCERLRQMPDPP